MSNSPRKPAGRSAAPVQLGNALDQFPGNLDEVPESTGALEINDSPAAISITQAELQRMIDEAVARGRADAAVELAGDLAPLSAEQEQAVSHISGDGRAPKVSARDRVWIVLEDNDDIPPGGQFIGVNGVGYQLLPGVEAFVPRAVCEVLDHAVKGVPVVDPQSRRVIGWKERKRFPYTIVQKGAAHARRRHCDAER